MGASRAVSFLSVSLCVPAATAFALDGARAVTQHILRVWQKEDGLPHNSVNCILQTQDGYVWIGTGGGLVRFDGVRFTLFDARNTAGMTTNAVAALAEDREGALWIGLTDGALVRRIGGRFVPYAGRGVLGGSITAVRAGASGSLWIGTYGNGIAHITDGRITSYTTRDGLPHDVVYAVFEDQDGVVWVGTDGGGLARFEHGRFTTFTTKDGLSSDSIYAVYRDPAGSLWIGTWGGGVNRLRDGKITVYGSKAGLPNDYVWSILEDRAGNLWVGTWGGGLSRMKAGRFETLAKKDGLSSNIVSAIHEDREGNLWVGTPGGLNRLKDGPFKSFSAREGLSDDTVLAVHEDREGSVWVGTRRGLNRVRDGKITTITTHEGLSNDTVTSLWADRKGNLWIGTGGGGVDRLSRGRITTYTTRQGLPSDTVWAVYADSRDVVWVGTPLGLGRLDGDRFVSLGAKEGLSNERVLSLHEARAGGLWVGTDGGGLFRFGEGRFTSHAAGGVITSFVQTLYEDSDGVLWMGTWGGGLGRLEDGRLTTYAANDGLANDIVTQILEDDLGNLWMRGADSVFRVEKRALQDFADGRVQGVASVAYGRPDGIKRSEYDAGGSQPAAWKGRDGRLWFATIEGVAVVDPRQLPKEEGPPAVRIEEVLVDDRPVVQEDVGTGRLEIAPGSLRLEFHYTGIGATAPERLHFRYRLDGLDVAWVDAGSRRVAYYTRLPPGAYRLRVAASHADGVWDGAEATLDLRLRPFFYQTGAFRGASTGIALAMAAGLYLARVRRMRARQRELEGMVEERTRHLREASAQIERANRELERMALIDGLTGIANRRHFDDLLAREWRRALREEKPLSLVMFDIDFFKAYNDAYGHPRGDECLKQVAQVLARGLRRPADVVARYGGEEFVALLPETDAEGAALLAERMRDGVMALALPHAGSAVAPRVTISAGVATAERCNGDAPGVLVAAADRALYEAKLGGRNQVRVAPPPHARTPPA